MIDRPVWSCHMVVSDDHDRPAALAFFARSAPVEWTEADGRVCDAPAGSSIGVDTANSDPRPGVHFAYHTSDGSVVAALDPPAGAGVLGRCTSIVISPETFMREEGLAVPRPADAHLCLEGNGGKV
jgi:hypothetical protein